MLDLTLIDRECEAICDAPHVPGLIASLQAASLHELTTLPLDADGGGIAWSLRPVLRDHGHELVCEDGLQGLVRYPFEEQQLTRIRRWVGDRAREELLGGQVPATGAELVAAAQALDVGGFEQSALQAGFAWAPELVDHHSQGLRHHTLAEALSLPTGQVLRMRTATDPLPASVARALWKAAVKTWVAGLDALCLHQALEAASVPATITPLWEEVRCQWRAAAESTGRGGVFTRKRWRPEVDRSAGTLRFIDGDRVIATLGLSRRPAASPLRLQLDGGSKGGRNRSASDPWGSLKAKARLELERDLCAHALDLLRRQQGPSVRLDASLAERDPSDRVLELLDDHLRSDPLPEAWAGWRVLRDANGQLALRAIRCTPAGDGTWAARQLLPPRDYGSVVQIEADHLVHERLRAPRDLRDRPASHHVQALRALVGHPRVFAGERGSTPLLVRSTRALLDVRTHQGGVRTQWIIDPRGASDAQPIDSAHAHRLLENHGDGVRAMWWASDSEVLVVDFQRALPITAALGRAGDWVPPGAVEGLLKRLPGIASRGDTRVDPRLEGAPRPPVSEAVVRLSSLPGSALAIDLRVEPAGELGGLFAPGEGPAALYGSDPTRFVVRREPEEEEAAARAVIGALGLSRLEHQGWSWPRIELIDAVGVLMRLTGHPELRVEWLTGKMAVRNAHSLSQMRLRLREKGRWFQLEGELTVDGASLGLADLLAQLRRGQRVLRLSNNDVIALTEELQADLLTLGSLAEPVAEGERLSVLAAPLLAELVDQGLQAELPPQWGDRLAALAAGSHSRRPDGLNATLRPYQEEGLAWLQQVSSWAPGACLADDMGLGKTVQALGLLLHRQEQGPALVVVPTSVLRNWQREMARFAPSLRPILHHGPGRQRDLPEPQPGQVVITSWGTVVRDLDRFDKVPWATVVLDEAQAIKNARTVRARAIRTLPAGFLLALTGTPIENAPDELWALFDAITPGLLGTEASFHTRFGVPLAHEPNGQQAKTLSRMMRPFLLRRRKSEVALDLPPRDEVTVPVVLSPPERERYEMVRSAAMASFGKGAKKKGAKRDRMKVLAALTRLRQLACHPRLVDPAGPATSSKLSEVRRVLLELREAGHQALVFSQFVTLLDLLAALLEPDGLRLGRLDGSMSTKRRQEQIDHFQAGGADAFLISLHAGGTGLNLTAATYVLHLDAWWNPAVHDQATDRAHRIGQDKPVTVLHFVAEDTVETGIVDMQRQKRGLVEGLLAGTAEGHKVTAAMLLGLIEAGGVSELALGHETHHDEPDLPKGPDSWPQPSGSSDPRDLQKLLGPALPWPIDGLEPLIANRLVDWATALRTERHGQATNYAKATYRLLQWCLAAGHHPEHLDDLESLAVAYRQALEKGLVSDPRRGDTKLAPAAVRAWLSSRA